MTSEEALAAIRNMQRRFGKSYKGRDLNGIWPALLDLPAAAMERAAGIIMRRCHYLPTADYLLAKVQEQAAWVPPAEDAADQRDEGREVLALFRAKIEGTLSAAEYARAMFAMADRYHKPEYAAIAHEAQGKAVA